MGFLSPVFRAPGNRYTMGRSVGHGLHQTMKEVWPGQLGLLPTCPGTWETEDGWSQPHRPDQHGSLPERVSPATKLSPVDTILVAATVVATTVPHTIQVGVGTGMVPAASPLVQGTVTCGESPCSLNQNKSLYQYFTSARLLPDIPWTPIFFFRVMALIPSLSSYQSTSHTFPTLSAN